MKIGNRGKVPFPWWLCVPSSRFNIRSVGNYYDNMSDELINCSPNSSPIRKKKFVAEIFFLAIFPRWFPRHFRDSELSKQFETTRRRSYSRQSTGQTRFLLEIKYTTFEFFEHGERSIRGETCASGTAKATDERKNQVSSNGDATN